METDLIESFAPIADEHSRLLILGTMPGVRSLQKQEYYGHPRNAFWPLIAELTGHRPSDDYAAKTAMLHEARIALYDAWKNAGHQPKDLLAETNAIKCFYGASRVERRNGELGYVWTPSGQFPDLVTAFEEGYKWTAA